MKFVVVTFAGKLFEEISRNAVAANFLDKRIAFFIVVNHDEFFAAGFDNRRRADLFARAAVRRKSEIRMMIGVGKFSARIFFNVGNCFFWDVFMVFGNTFGIGKDGFN